MRTLKNIESVNVGGGFGVSFDVNVGVESNRTLGFSSGFQFALDAVGTCAGFWLGIFSSVIVLPAQGLYYVGRGTYDTFIKN
jgi:hypothetical protein